MSKKKVYYHASAYENLGSILIRGLKASPIDGLVYMTEKEEDAVKFLYIRGCRDIVTFKITLKDDSRVIETFDHNPAFFKCRCFGYRGDIPFEMIQSSKRYELWKTKKRK